MLKTAATKWHCGEVVWTQDKIRTYYHNSNTENNNNNNNKNEQKTDRI